MLAQRMPGSSHPEVSNSLGRALPTAACQTKISTAQVRGYSALPLLMLVKERPCGFSQEYTQLCLPECEKHLSITHTAAWNGRRNERLELCCCFIPLCCADAKIQEH